MKMMPLRLVFPDLERTIRIKVPWIYYTLLERWAKRQSLSLEESTERLILNAMLAASEAMGLTTEVGPVSPVIRCIDCEDCGRHGHTHRPAEEGEIILCGECVERRIRNGSAETFEREVREEYEKRTGKTVVADEPPSWDFGVDWP